MGFDTRKIVHIFSSDTGLNDALVRIFVCRRLCIVFELNIYCYCARIYIHLCVVD